MLSGAALLSQLGSATRVNARDTEEKSGTFSGQVVLDGEVPKLAPAATANGFKGEDLKVCGIQEVPDERLIVDPKSKGIANVFVYLAKAPVGMPAELKKSQQPIVKFGQKALQFVPHALLIRTDQTAHIQSKDKVDHHAHFHPARNVPYGEPYTAPDEIVSRTFKHPERQPFEVSCDVHPWMHAWWLVLDHPYSAITDATGRFRIGDLPPGDHEFVVWQERAGYIERTFKVKIDGQQKPLSETIKVPVAKFKLE